MIMTAVASWLEDNLLTIELNDPAQGNALDNAMLSELVRLLEAAKSSDATRAVLVRGTGENFCLGDRRGEMGELPEPLRHRAPSGSHGHGPLLEHALWRAIRATPKPVVAAVHGRAQDLGLDLACVCDFRIAAADASFQDTRVAQGRHGATGVTYYLPRLIGLSRAMAMILAGEVLGAAEAREIGLVCQLSSRENFENEVNAFARKLAQLPTRAFAVRKEMVLAQLDLTHEMALHHCLAVRQTNVIEDVAEGLRAWREKRPPNFSGR